VSHVLACPSGQALGRVVAVKVCLVPGCGRLQPESRCAEHRREHERARGSAAERGYGTMHRAERDRWALLVATGNVKCWRCGDYIASDSSWDLGHDDQDRSKYRGPEHQACNRATASRRR
jgi:hypothetical protein